MQAWADRAPLRQTITRVLLLSSSLSFSGKVANGIGLALGTEYMALRELFGGSQTEVEGLVVGTLDGDHRGSKDQQLGNLGLGRRLWHKDHVFDAHAGREARQRRGGVAGAGCGDDVLAQLHGLNHPYSAGPIFERGRGIAAIVLDPEMLQSQRLCQPPGPVEGCPAHLQWGHGATSSHRQQRLVAPDGIGGISSQLLPG